MRKLVGRAVDDGDVEAAYADLAGLGTAARPYVVVNMVASADGAIAIQGRTEALSSEADRFVFHYLRSLADVILVGAQTVRAERYGPPRIAEERQAERVRRGQAPVPRIAIVSGSLDLDWTSRLFRETPSRPIVLTTSSADTAAVPDVADVLAVGTPRVDLAAAIVELGALGAGTILCEGGPTLNGVLAASDLIDELCLTVAPALVGGDVGTGLLGHTHIPELVPMSLVHALEDRGDLFLRYRRLAMPRPVVRPVGEALEPAEGPSVHAFNRVMGDLDVPMLIVTASAGKARSGCLVGFGTQCSIDPPRFMVLLSKKNHTYRVARRAETLTVHVPASDQHALAERFGTLTGDEVDKFDGVAWRRGPHDGIVLSDVARWFVGRITETLDCGDHVAFVLQPLDGEVGSWSGQLGMQAVKDLEAGHGA